MSKRRLMKIVTWQCNNCKSVFNMKTTFCPKCNKSDWHLIKNKLLSSAIEEE